MNVVEGLTAANLALGSVKDLKDIDRSVDEAGYKLKIAEMTSALADAKIALSDAKLKIAVLEEAAAEQNKGFSCPKCRTGRLVVSSTKKVNAILEQHSRKCDNLECDYDCSSQFDTGAMCYRTYPKA